MLTWSNANEGKPLDDEKSEQDSGLYNTNSTDESHTMQTDASSMSKGTRESFEQHEISLGIVDEFGRLRRNSDLVKDPYSGGNKEKGNAMDVMDGSFSRIEVPERERTFVKSANTTIEEHVGDVEDLGENVMDDDAVSCADTYVMSRSEQIDVLLISSCEDEDGDDFLMQNDVTR